MRNGRTTLIALLLLIGLFSFSTKVHRDESVVYVISKLKEPLRVDGNWDKEPWEKVKELDIQNYMGPVPGFKPISSAKMMYDDENLYLIFRVEDKFVRIQTQTPNGPVSEDSCVEFLFAPDATRPLQYFNLEINAGGTPFLGYHMDGRKNHILVNEIDLKKIEIAHSLPSMLNNEMIKPITWTIECRVPLSILTKYSKLSLPESGVSWKANFYKTSSKSTNPHWITWSPVHSARPDFHLPQYFGKLTFE